MGVSEGSSDGGTESVAYVENACSDAVEDARAEHPVGVLSTALQSCTDHGPRGGEADGEDTAVLVSERTSPEGTDKRAREVVDGNLSQRHGQSTCSG